MNEAEKWFLKAEKLAPSDPVVQHHLGEIRTLVFTNMCRVEKILA